jgi:5-methyltetrahydropteroyltriglutamate--homocysteine methyltransferase
MFVPELTGSTYATREELADDVVRLLRSELHDLACEGVDFVQFDEPTLTELVFSRPTAGVLMSAAFEAKRDVSVSEQLGDFERPADHLR